MHTVDLKTEVKTIATLNGKDVDNVLQEVCHAAHEAFFYTSRCRANHEDDKDILDELELIEGELCSILDLLGD